MSLGSLFPEYLPSGIENPEELPPSPSYLTERHAPYRGIPAPTKQECPQQRPSSKSFPSVGHSDHAGSAAVAGAAARCCVVSLLHPGRGLSLRPSSPARPPGVYRLETKVSGRNAGWRGRGFEAAEAAGCSLPSPSRLHQRIGIEFCFHLPAQSTDRLCTFLGPVNAAGPIHRAALSCPTPSCILPVPGIRSARQLAFALTLQSGSSLSLDWGRKTVLQWDAHHSTSQNVAISQERGGGETLLIR